MESICLIDSNWMIFLTMITQAKGVKPCVTPQETGVIETRIHPKESPGTFKC